MAQMVERSGERRLQLSGEEIIRPMLWRSQWSKIRLGMRLGFQGVQNIATYTGGMGVCVGNAGYATQVAIAYLGMFLDVSFTYTPTAGPYFASGSGNNQLTVKQGSTITTTAGGSFVQNVAWAPSNLSQYMVDIAKVGNVYTLNSRGPTTADVVRTVLVYDFLRNMEDESGTLLYISGSSTAQATTLNDGYQFDTASIFHGKTVPVMEIGSWEVFRFE
jgi:hypothetical protein